MNLKEISKSRADMLKIIAITAMLIDHIGLVFFPENLDLRVIGRLAFPIFAFQIAEGFHYTKNRRKYIIRMLIFGIISQIPYFFLFDNGQINIILTFVLSLLFLFAIDNKKYIFAPLIFVPLFMLDFEYSLMGVIAPLIFYYFRNYKIIAFALFSFLTYLSIMLGYIHYIQYFAIVGALICFVLPNINYNFKVPRNFFYIFYPGHLFFILLLLFFIDN